MADEKEKSKTDDLGTDGGQGEPKVIDIKLPTGEPTTTGKKTRKKKSEDTAIVKEADPILKSNIFALVGTVNKLSAVRLGKKWEFTDDEVLAIADPAARICERHGLGAETGKYTDYIMLALAVGLPVGMRLLVGQETAKKEGGLILAEPSSIIASESGDNSERKIKSDNKQGSKKTTDDLTNVIDSRLPAIADIN